MLIMSVKGKKLLRVTNINVFSVPR